MMSSSSSCMALRIRGGWQVADVCVCATCRVFSGQARVEGFQTDTHMRRCQAISPHSNPMNPALALVLSEMPMQAAC